MKAPEGITAQEWLGQLKLLREQAGFVSLDRAHDEAIAELQLKINDLQTSPHETQEYKRAREEMEKAKPSTLLKNLITTATNAAKREHKGL